MPRRRAVGGYINNQDSNWPIITNHTPRDWSLITGRGGYKMRKSRVRVKLFAPPPPFKGWQLFAPPPPSLWLKLQAPILKLLQNSAQLQSSQEATSCPGKLEHNTSPCGRGCRPREGITALPLGGSKPIFGGTVTQL